MKFKVKTFLSARKWQRLWSREWVLKFVSLVLAILLWYFVGGEEIVDKNVMVPIEIINLPRDLVISNQFKKEIVVTVSGPRTAIQEMTNRAVARQINLSSATPGTNVIENDTKSIPVPRGVTVLRIQPSSIILSLDKLIQKDFQIAPFTTGDVAAGYELKELVMNPEKITITGPETVLSQADRLMTEIIDINGLKESKSLQVPLDLDPSFVELIGQTSVTAEVVVSPKMVAKKLIGVPVKTKIDGVKQEVRPAKVDILLRVPVLLLRDTKDVRTLFAVTTGDRVGEDGLLEVEVRPNPANGLPLEVISIVPDKVAPASTTGPANHSTAASVDGGEDAERSDAVEENEEHDQPPDDDSLLESESAPMEGAAVKIHPIHIKQRREH